MMSSLLRRLSGVLVVAALGAAACAVSAPESSSEEAPPAAATSPSSSPSPSAATSTTASALDRGDEPGDTTLATLRLSPTHVVTFSESSDGDLEVVERMSADRDQGQPSLAAFDVQGATLSRLHRYLAPSAPVPTALAEADGRAAARLPNAPDPTPPDDAFTIADQLYPAPPSSGWDWVNDANWFAQYYYTGGNDGFFAANATHISQTKKRWTNWYKSSAFNQSFEGGAWFRVKRSYGCGLGTCSSTKLSEPVANRDIITYLGTGNRWRQSWMDGNGTNPRVALAVRWVLSGSDLPPAPPAGCGGHNQIVCWNGAHCKPGLAEYNGGCYGCGTNGQNCCKDWGPIPTPGGVYGFCAQGICRWPGGNCQI